MLPESLVANLNGYWLLKEIWGGLAGMSDIHPPRQHHPNRVPSEPSGLGSGLHLMECIKPEILAAAAPVDQKENLRRRHLCRV